MTRTRRSVARALLCAAALAASAPLVHAQPSPPTPTTFTYQGELKQNNTPASGVFDMQFRLYDALSGPNQLGGTYCLDDVAVTAGRFSVQLDFGTQFTGTGLRYLEVDVRPGAGLSCATTTGYTTLTPRQSVTAAPRAMSAQTAAQLTGSTGAGVVNVDTRLCLKTLFSGTA